MWWETRAQARLPDVSERLVDMVMDVRSMCAACGRGERDTWLRLERVGILNVLFRSLSSKVSFRHQKAWLRSEILPHTLTHTDVGNWDESMIY